MAWPTYSRTTENPASSATACTAVPMSCSRLPSRIWSMPAHRLCSVTSHAAGVGLGRHVPDAHGEGGVAVVALDDRPAVDRDDVALVQPVAAGDAVDDHVVGRGADDGREAVVAEEVGPGAPRARTSTGHGVQLGGRRPRAGWPPGCARASRPRPAPPGASWRSRRRCASRPPRPAVSSPGAAGCARAGGRSARTRRPVTSSGSPRPSTATSWSALGVPVDQRRGLSLVQLEPAADGRLGVVLPLDDLAAADVADPVRLAVGCPRCSWPRSRRTPAGRPGGRGRPRSGPRGRPRGRSRRAPASSARRLGLVDGAGKAVEHEAPRLGVV